MTPAERDQGVTEPGACWICDATPEPCEEHPDSPVGPRGCQACSREAFAEWLARVGPRRICQGSGMRDVAVACPGCAACATVNTPCPAFASPDEPWIPESEKRGPCACCGGPIEKHRLMPSLPEDEPPPKMSEGALVILRDPR